jgi:hypothetical protein
MDLILKTARLNYKLQLIMLVNKELHQKELNFLKKVYTTYSLILMEMMIGMMK